MVRPFFYVSLVATATFFSLGSSVYGMQKLPEDTSRNETLATQSATQKHNISIKTPEGRFSFNGLSIGLTNRIADFLDYHDQFRLAATSRHQLFLWTTTKRVPDAVSLTLTTPDVTLLNWQDANQPTTTSRTLIVETKQSIEEEELEERLNNLTNLEELIHLHFVTNVHEEVSVEITKLLVDIEFSRRFSSLESLVFKHVIPNGIISSFLYNEKEPSLQTLQNFVIQGRAFLSRKEKSTFPIGGIVRRRPNVKNVCFFQSQLAGRTVAGMLNNLHSRESHKVHRILEIRDNTLDNYGTQTKQKDPWQNGLYFPIKPWVIDEDGNGRVLYKTFYAPGPSRLRHVLVREGEEHRRLTWDQLLAFLSPAYFSVVDLMPVLRTWTTEGRLTALTRLIPDSRIDRQPEGNLAFVLPVALQEAFHLFLQGSNPQTSTETNQQTTLPERKTPPSEASALDETIQIAASRYSAETIQVSMRDLIGVIRENAQSHPAVQSLLGELPALSNTRENLLGWFREVLEHFNGDTADDTKEPNTAEVLVGTQLMPILRILRNLVSL